MLIIADVSGETHCVEEEGSQLAPLASEKFCARPLRLAPGHVVTTAVSPIVDVPQPHAKPIAAVASQACTSPVPDSCASTFNSAGTANSLWGQRCHEMSRSMTQYSRAILWCAFAFNSCPKIMLPKHPHGVFFMMVVARPVYDLVRPLHFPFIGSCLLFAPNSSYTYDGPHCVFAVTCSHLAAFILEVCSVLVLHVSELTSIFVHMHCILDACLTFSRSSCVSLASHSALLPHLSVFSRLLCCTESCLPFVSCFLL